MDKAAAMPREEEMDSTIRDQSPAEQPGPATRQERKINSQIVPQILEDDLATGTLPEHPDLRTEFKELEKELVIDPEVFASIPDQRIQLCARCSSIDFDQIMQAVDDTRDEGVPVQPLGHIDDLLSSECPLCLLWGRMSPPPVEEDNPPELVDGVPTGKNHRYLRVFDFNKHLIGLSPDVLKGMGGQATLLGVVNKPPSLQHLLDNNMYTEFYAMAGPAWFWLNVTGYICLTDVKHQLRTMSTRLINSEQIDLNMVRQWLDYCRNNHEEVCGKPSTSAFGLKVIDCVSRKIVDAPKDCKYTALSYVWGRPSVQSLHSKPSTPGTDLPELPKTIEDSIYVTRELGLQYLWIDKYCIDQTDRVEKHRHIHQMDLIYSGAELTLIAAAGEDPDHGLPGINGTPRNEQYTLRIGDYLLTDTLPAPDRSVDRSTWATRAWTYQEAILSRRRLVFTSDQTMFECDSLNCAESKDVSLDALSTISPSKDKVPIGSCFAFKRPGTDSNMWSFIGEYYDKKLSYREDKLDALQGILRCFETSERPFLNLWGIPLFNPEWYQSDIASSLLFLPQLLWEMRDTNERIPNHPSWSWAGWHGGIVYQVGLGLEHFTQPKLYHPRVWVESVTGEFELFPENVSSLEDWSFINMQSRFLEVEAWTISCSILKDPKPQTEPTQNSRLQGYCAMAKIPLNEIECAYQSIVLSSTEDREQIESGSFSRPCIGVILPARLRKYGTHWIWILVVAKKGDFWERVGHFRIYRLKRSLDGVGSLPGLGGSSGAERWFAAAPKKMRRVRLG